PFDVSVHFGELGPGQAPDLADTPVFGVAAMGGGQDARSVLYRWGIVKPGRVGDYFPPEHPQHPKVPALGSLQHFAMWLLSLSGPRTLPLHIVDLGPHRIAALPFEPSAVAGFRIERALCAGNQSTGSQIQDCMIVGYSGAYGGYLVTAEEYDAQEYEGASTLYGRHQARVIRHALVRIAASPLSPPETGVAVFETGRHAHWMK
ncbi:MAG: hypothetical protein GXP62_02220, partial [Oligoflexia bacterium]|nr:hypothetical protein [Oligoflexia bacterium]